MVEVKERGEQVIRRDILVRKHSLNTRQEKALGFLLQQGKMAIQDFENLCPEVNRRSLQRDIKKMVIAKVIYMEGATHQQEYKLL